MGRCCRTADLNSQADATHSATNNPFEIRISDTELTAAWCLPAISATTATNA